jgi:hypothetical protein
MLRERFFPGFRRRIALVVRGGRLAPSPHSSCHIWKHVAESP